MIAILRQLLAILLLLTSLGSLADAARPCTPPYDCTEASIFCDCGVQPSSAKAASCLQDCQLQVIATPSQPAPAGDVAVLNLFARTLDVTGFATAPPVPPPRLA